MIDWNKPIRTTCGKPVRVICTDRKSSDGRSRMLLIDRGGGYESADFADDQGRGGMYAYENVPEKRRVRWVNVYKNGLEEYHRSAQSADVFASMFTSSERIACVKFEYEVPEVMKND